MRVLVVDDDPVFRKLLGAWLARSATALPAGTFAEALSKAAEADAALLDLHLPDGHGPDLVRSLRAAAPALPIVVLSGEDDPGVRRACLEAGAKEFLLKGGLTGDALLRALGL